MSFQVGQSARRRSQSRGRSGPSLSSANTNTRSRSKSRSKSKSSRSLSRRGRNNQSTADLSTPSDYSISVNPLPYTHAESHHVIRFKAPTGPTLVTPEKPRHSTRDQARLAVKKRLELSGTAVSNSSGSGSSTAGGGGGGVVKENEAPIGSGIKTTSKLKTGQERRGRDVHGNEHRSRSRSRSVSRVLRSLSLKRNSNHNHNHNHNNHNHNHNNNDNDNDNDNGSVGSKSSIKSTRSTRSIRSVGSRVLTKVKSFRSSSGRSVGSTRSRSSRGSRKGGRFWRRRRKKRDGTGENFVYVSQSPVPVLKHPKKPKGAGKDGHNGGILGMNILCHSLEQVTLCRDFLCGTEEMEEDLVGTTVGMEDPNDPRY